MVGFKKYTFQSMPSAKH